MIGSRAYDNGTATALYKLDKDSKMVEIVRFPSSGDTGYPGLLVHKDIDKPLRLFAGSDEQLVAALAMGFFHGGIGTTYNIIPRHFSEIYRLVMENRVHEATTIQEEANRVIELMISSENRSYGKAMMKYIGLGAVSK